MPNHWESSARPLFVRTVFVNGNRHAILFEEDPLLRCGNSLGNLPFKKVSRSNSSLSFSSDLSITSSESQDSTSEERVPRLRSSSKQRRKDLSSELQSCLIKLRLASGNLASRSKSDEEKCFCNSKESEESQKEVSKQEKRKWKRDKSCKRKNCEGFKDESKEDKITRQQNNKENSCYFYNCESNKRKKNYCVVKISSQPPQVSLSCRCGSNLSASHKCRGFPSGKNNMLISATIHNLYMTGRKDKAFEDKIHNPFFCDNPDSFDFYWNAYLSRSYYNSLSERVFQWLDLASKKKNQKKQPISNDEVDILSGTERIFSGKTFIGESIKTENSNRSDNKRCNKALMKKKEKVQNDSFKRETETEVVIEPNLKTYATKEDSQYDFLQCVEEGTTISKPTDSGSISSSEFILKSAAIQQLNTQSSTKSLKIQDLLLDYNFRENFNISLGKRNKRKIRETRDPQKFSNNHSDCRETDSTEEDENIIKTTFNHSEKRIYKRSHKSDGSGEHTPCHCDGSSDDYADKIRNQLLTERISETNQKSINNLSFTRARPVLIQNLLSSQRRDEISAMRTEKIVWDSEKETGKLQLHIFMPSLLLREASEDSMSDCENVFNLC